MRRDHRELVSFGVLSIALSAYAGGCTRVEECNLDPGCADEFDGFEEESWPPNCIPLRLHKDTGQAIADRCGIFVSLSGDDANEGTRKASPVKTIGRAIELAKEISKPIYACAEIFPEAIELPRGIEIYGGLNCAVRWHYAGDIKKTTLAPGPDLIPVRFSPEGETMKAAHLEDIVVVAADATLPGGSSIAAVADAVGVKIVRSELIAGNGMPGADGAGPAPPPWPQAPDDPALVGYDAHPACSSDVFGPYSTNPKVNEGCALAIGGEGGVGLEAHGNNGNDGSPTPIPNLNMAGWGGEGATVSACKAGMDGASGKDGKVGAGATSADLGTFDYLTGYTGAPGKNGGDGGPGQGGIGGNGGMGGPGYSGPGPTSPGCNGGSGGTGGTGGRGGGGRGGHSVAIAWKADELPELPSVTVLHGDAGKGGLGDDPLGLGADGKAAPTLELK